MSFFDATNNIGRFDTKHGDGFIIHFVHVATRDTAHFKAFLTSWEDQVKQNWKSYETVGRMDPIMIYSRTGRQIIFSIEIPSVDEEEALLNMVQVERMIRMSYPTFDGGVESEETGTQVLVSDEEAKKNRQKKIEEKTKEIFETNNPNAVYEEAEVASGEEGVSSDPEQDANLQALREAKELATREVENESQAEDYSAKVAQGKITEPTKSITRDVTFFSRTASTMVSPPLMRMKFANWSSDTNIDQQYSTSADNSTSGPGGESGAGLYGVIDNIKFAPDLGENGGFYASKAFGEDGKSYLIPKLLKLDIVFTVLHASDLGYNSSTRKLRTPGFPYNAENIYKNYQKRKVEEAEKKFKMENANIMDGITKRDSVFGFPYLADEAATQLSRQGVQFFNEEETLIRMKNSRGDNTPTEQEKKLIQDITGYKPPNPSAGIPVDIQKIVPETQLTIPETTALNASFTNTNQVQPRIGPRGTEAPPIAERATLDITLEELLDKK